MYNYLSMGLGVNSVAGMLVFIDEGIEHQAVYVNHGCDWPETLDYLKLLQGRGYQITELVPKIEGYSNLYEYLFAKGKIAMRKPRWCTKDWKTKPLSQYYKTPAWVNICYASDEAHRAQIYSEPGFEYRFPLIEREINRKKCIEIIKAHGLPVPMKSGCWFCPFQGIKEYKKLRRLHPDLFCKVIELEKRHNEVSWDRYMRCDAATILHKPMAKVIDDGLQGWLIQELEYPPCQCGL